MVISFHHYNNSLGRFREIKIGRYPDDGGYGKLQCMKCACIFDYDIFVYENITEIRNSKGSLEIVAQCPRCKTKDLEWNLKK